jgi:hypothetical protein
LSIPTAVTTTINTNTITSTITAQVTITVTNTIDTSEVLSATTTLPETAYNSITQTVPSTVVTIQTITALAPTLTITNTVSSTSTTTITTTTTVQAPVCTQPFVNGGFEAGNIGSWTYTPGYGFFDTALTTDTVVNNPSVAEQGSYYLLVETGSGDVDLSFSLSQTLNGLCPGQQYQLSFYSTSTNPPAGATSCDLSYCIGSTCNSGDPGLASTISVQQTMLYTPGPGVNSATFSMTTTCCGGIFGSLCERSSVLLDNFQLVPVAST